MFFKIGFLKNFTTLTEKKLVLEYLFEGLSPATLLKADSNADVFL